MSEDQILDMKGGSSWQLPAIVVLGLIALGGLAFGWSASSKLDSTQQAVASQLKTTQQSIQQDMSSLKDRLAQDEKANTDLQGDLKVVTDKLKITQGQLKKARAESAKLNDETNQKVTALDTSVHSELATKASSDDVKSVDTKVVGVRTDLDTTREDLKMAKSEMGTLIARNHDEIDPQALGRARLHRVHHYRQKPPAEGRQCDRRAEGYKPKAESVQRGHGCGRQAL